MHAEAFEGGADATGSAGVSTLVSAHDLNRRKACLGINEVGIIYCIVYVIIGLIEVRGGALSTIPRPPSTIPNLSLISRLLSTFSYRGSSPSIACTSASLPC